LPAANPAQIQVIAHTLSRRSRTREEPRGDRLSGPFTPGFCTQFLHRKSAAFSMPRFWLEIHEIRT
jgi:hypothetical protein